MKKIKVLLALIAILTMCISVTYASTEENLVLSATEQFDGPIFKAANNIDSSAKFLGSAYLAGNIVTTKGEITKDFIVVGNQLNTSSKVGGDIISAGQTLSINGVVDGNVRVAGQNIDFGGSISKNVIVFAQRVNFNNANIGGEILLGAQFATFTGTYNDKITSFSENTTLSGTFNDDVYITSDSKDTIITISESAKLNGMVFCKSPTAPIISNGQDAKVKWEQTTAPLNNTSPNTKTSEKPSLIFLILNALGYFLLGFLIYKLLPKKFLRQELTNENILSTIGFGVLGAVLPAAGLFVTIILFLLSFLITPVVGFISLFGFTTIVMVLYFLSIIPVSYWLGGLLVNGKKRPMLSFAVGLVILTFIPYIAAMFNGTFAGSEIIKSVVDIAKFILSVIGMGIIISVIFTKEKKRIIEQSVISEEIVVPVEVEKLEGAVIDNQEAMKIEEEKKEE